MIKRFEGWFSLKDDDWVEEHKRKFHEENSDMFSSFDENRPCKYCGKQVTIGLSKVCSDCERKIIDRERAVRREQQERIQAELARELRIQVLNDFEKQKKKADNERKEKEMLKKKIISDLDPYGEEVWETINSDEFPDKLSDEHFCKSCGAKLKPMEMSVCSKCTHNEYKKRDKKLLKESIFRKFVVCIDSCETLTKNKIYTVYKSIKTSTNEFYYVKDNRGSFSYYFKDRFIDISRKEAIRKMKEMNKLEKNLKDKNRDIYPYGEEDWISEKKISYQKELCQDIWNGDIIKEKIKKKLIKIAKDFYDDIDLETEIKDIVLTGSMANYNYTESSDIDVHIIIDFADVNEDTVLVKRAVDGQRFIWNLRHNITIKGHDVELYVQDDDEEHRSSGLYSLFNDKWIIKPTYNPPDIEDIDIDVKYDARLYAIEKFEKLSKRNLTSEESEELYNSAKDLKTKIMKSRKDGLESGGEFSIENLVFKKLRAEGGIKKLIDTITRFYDKIYSQ